MGVVLHGSATTTEAVRRAVQNSQESLRTLSKRFGINQKTVAKWKKRTSVADLPTGPKTPTSTGLTMEEEAAVVALLPLSSSSSPPSAAILMPLVRVPLFSIVKLAGAASVA